ncbi:fructokinase [Microbacterium sp. cf046]|uniref:PfkB family carbohydrate kinase n=1 Tax=Microbacterium sp. cf046 TaxID=1761803 RepID=UPI0008EE4251|nr:PfkB family carbohydrate kinase [Microbacterium sp. cf046]SFS15582.1 fructokinase [Microbacterium sp. cf046]
MSGRIVVIGDALIDELRDDTGVREFVGGAALNVAVGLTRLGVPTTLIAMVGDDEAGAHIRSYLADYGVDLIATPSALGSSRAVSTRSAAGEPVYEFNAAAQARGIVFGDDVRDAIADADIVAVSCYPFDNAEQTELLAAALEGTPGTLAIDPNPRSGMMSDLDGFVRGFETLAAWATLVKVGEDDAALLYGEPLDALRARLVELGVDVVLATQGSSGATIEAGDIVVTRPISNLPGRIVDTMGAGDAAFAAAVASLMDGAEKDEDAWGEALERAMDVAAATCRFEGALLRLPESLADLDLDRIGT